MEENVNIPYLSLEEEVADEVYSLIDKHLKPLPKKSDGSIDKEADGFQHNDVDALRHAYASGVFTMEYGETVSLALNISVNPTKNIGFMRPWPSSPSWYPDGADGQYRHRSSSDKPV